MILWLAQGDLQICLTHNARSRIFRSRILISFKAQQSCNQLISFTEGLNLNRFFLPSQERLPSPYYIQRSLRSLPQVPIMRTTYIDTLPLPKPKSMTFFGAFNDDTLLATLSAGKPFSPEVDMNGTILENTKKNCLPPWSRW